MQYYTAFLNPDLQHGVELEFSYFVPILVFGLPEVSWILALDMHTFLAEPYNLV